MGFSVSGATAVVFVGVLISAATLYPAIDRYTERRSDAVAADDERTLARQNTDIEPVNATYDADTGVLAVRVRNTGANALAVSRTDLLVDGRYAGPPAAAAAVEGDTTTDVWAPGELLTITTSEPAAPARIKIVTGPGVADTSAVEVI